MTGIRRRCRRSFRLTQAKLSSSSPYPSNRQSAILTAHRSPKSSRNRYPAERQQREPGWQFTLTALPANSSATSGTTPLPINFETDGSLTRLLRQLFGSRHLRALESVQNTCTCARGGFSLIDGAKIPLWQQGYQRVLAETKC